MNERRLTRCSVIAWFTLAAALVLAGCGGAAAPVAPRTAAPTAAGQVTLPAEVNVTYAAALRDAGAFVLDVREPDEWAAGHIPGAILIPLGQLEDRFGEVPRDRTIVTVCRSGNRSAEGRDILRQAGLTAVTSMDGGMNDWTAAGLPVVSGP